MSVRVIVPPEPIVTPDLVAGDHTGDDAGIVALIAAAQEQIDGPGGWLGRALGVQTLEVSLLGFGWSSYRLPYPPLIAVEAITYVDDDEVRREVPPDTWLHDEQCLWLARGKSWPASICREGAVRIRYTAGYDGQDIDGGGTGAVPERVKQAIILSVQYAKNLGAENLFLRSEDVEGVGVTTYTVSSMASDLITASCDRLLSNLRVYR